MKTLKTILAIASLLCVGACAQSREAAGPSQDPTMAELEWAAAPSPQTAMALHAS